MEEICEINGFPQKAEKNTEQLFIDLANEMGISTRLLKLLLVIADTNIAHGRLQLL